MGLFGVIAILCVCVSKDLIYGLRIEVSPPNNRNETEPLVDKGDNITFACYHNRPIFWNYPHNRIEITPEITSDISNTGEYVEYITVYDVDDPAVGFYTCMEKFDISINSSVYLYVRGASSLYVQVSNTIYGKEYRPLIIPCRPTFPDIDVELYHISDAIKLGVPYGNASWSYDARVGFVLNITNGPTQTYMRCDFYNGIQSQLEFIVHHPFDPKYGFTISNPPDDFSFSDVSCYYYLSDNDSAIQMFDDEKSYNYMPKPTIVNDTIEDYFSEGERMGLICKLELDDGREIPTFSWYRNGQEIKNGSDGRIFTKNYYFDNYFPSSILNITHLEKTSDAGNYTCVVKDSDSSNSHTINIPILGAGSHFIRIAEENSIYDITEEEHKNVTWSVQVTAYPRVEVKWRFDGVSGNKEIRDSDKYKISVQGFKHSLTIADIGTRDIGNYTITARNKHGFNTASVKLLVRSKPIVELNMKKFNLLNLNNSISCSATGYPQPDVALYFKLCKDERCPFTKRSPENKPTRNQITTNMTTVIQSSESGFVKCVGTNSIGETEKIEEFIITDVENGFHVWLEENDDKIDFFKSGESMKMAYDDEVSFYCASANQKYTDELSWYYNNTPLENYTKTATNYSYKSYYQLNSIEKHHSGKYTCRAKQLKTGKIDERTLFLNVTAPKSPKIVKTNLNATIETLIYPKEYQLFCMFDGIPRPKVVWKKDGADYIPDGDRVKFEQNSQVLSFRKTATSDEGTYECVGSNKVGNIAKSAYMGFSNKEKPNPFIYVTIVILILVILVVVTCLLLKIRKANELRRKLKAVGLEDFEKGRIESLNPEIAIDDQAELLPYNKHHWEIPKENIKLGKQLGAGAFGVVMKAEVVGLNPNDPKESTTVAVKMVKKTVDWIYMKALIDELKIMGYLGSHVNVVNLIGACTSNIVKHEILVVVEYCRFGNLHNYLLRHRGNFINQIDPDTNTIDYNIGAQELLERTFSISSNQSQDAGNQKEMQDYRDNNTAHTQYTATTTVCMTPTGQDEPLTSSNSIQPEWRSNYRCDYKGKIKPICTKDLLTWGFQVARGMDYLASRKVLHGDLAARNILLSDNNIVKICDFGLAKRMYQDDNYKKQNNSPLPIKWMAIESITDRVFSTQSDVWAFGIVMWELFSLAKTPYPGMEADEKLYHKLVSGYRMESPQFATPEIYQIMTDCWKTKPLSRPTFTKLTERIGSLLEQAVLKYYIDLNDPYLQMNTKFFDEIQSDYLQMASPPDFANLSTPQYINYDSGISSPVPGQSYLPMKPAHIFSPTTLKDREFFTFDNVPKERQPPAAMEMAPMLDLKDGDNFSKPNSPEPGETPSYSNPSYNKMPVVKQNILKTKDNYVNMPQNKANMDFGGGEDKGDKDGIHHYVNNVSRDWERDLIRV